MPFETIQELLQARREDDGVAVAYGDRTWTWREHLAEASAEASFLLGLMTDDRPLHAGALLGNSPSMLRSMAAAAAKPLVPVEVSGVDPVLMIFTSGTSGDPKAVRFAHAMGVMCGASLVERFGLSCEDVCYLSMPLFHSNGVAAGWSVAISCGATMVPAKFSPSRFLADIRRYGVTYMNYVGKPLALVLATPEQPDDSDNPLRAAFGNEATEYDLARFA